MEHKNDHIHLVNAQTLPDGSILADKITAGNVPKAVKEMLAVLEHKELALTALRSMQEAGEPLSLEQLKQMVGKPVWIERIEAPYDGKWFIVNYADTESPDKTLYTDSGVTYSEYGKYFIAYPYPPAHIDRGKWEYCLTCRDLRYLPYEVCAGIKMPGGSEIGASFCPSCGRPLTEEAWAELERRLRG